MTELRSYLSHHLTDVDAVILLGCAWPQAILTEAASVCSAFGKSLLVPGPSIWQEYESRIEPSTGQRSAKFQPPSFLDKDVYEAIERIPLDHAFSSDTPVLAVVHLSNVVLGKWHSELTLRDTLLQGGIKFAQVGSAPHSELFGMEYSLNWNLFSGAFPIQLLQTYANAILESVEAENSETPKQLIVVSVDYRAAGVKQDRSQTWASLAALAFLAGIQPDALLLVLNECDDLGHIVGPLRAIQGLSPAPVLGAIQNQFYNPVSAELLPKQAKRFLDQSRSSIDSQWKTHRNERMMEQLGVRSYDLLNNREATDFTEVVRAHFGWEPGEAALVPRR